MTEGGHRTDWSDITPAAAAPRREGIEPKQQQASGEDCGLRASTLHPHLDDTIPSPRDQFACQESPRIRNYRGMLLVGCLPLVEVTPGDIDTQTWHQTRGLDGASFDQ